MADQADNVRVALRIRPLIPKESIRGCHEVIERVADTAQVVVQGNRPFTYNYVFDGSDSQEHIYDVLVPQILNKLIDGYNATVLAYGQTSSGKTYTMGTAFDGQLNSESGIIPRAMCDIFKRLETLSNEYEVVVKCSFTELYQEQLYDLLSGKPRQKAIIEIRQSSSGIVMVDVTEVPVTSAQETIDCLVRGFTVRAVCPTAMNEQSSRSHAIFTVTLKLTKKDETGIVTTSKLSLVDLAGSERVKKTQATGDRFKEGVKINQGLFCLGNVIAALVSGQGAKYVNFRDSKLTRLLQDSLGGNAITLMIVCVSPADDNVEETLNTLRYADSARKIKNQPIVNKNKPDEVDSYPEKYCDLQQKLRATLQHLADAELRTHLAEESEKRLLAEREELKLILDKMEQKENESFDGANAVDLTLVKQFMLVLERQTVRQEQSEDDERRHFLSIGIVDSEEEVGKVELLELQEKTDAHITKQMEYKERLNHINRQISVKEEEHSRATGDSASFLDKTMHEKKCKEYEQKLKKLEEGKLNLVDKLKNMKEQPLDNRAEEYSRRLQALEKEISDLKCENMDQSKLLEEQEKVARMKAQIIEMRKAKVKLLREMHEESKKYDKWMRSNEKEISQLRARSNKFKEETARKESLLIKQRNVYKRRYEEAVAANKRLKEAAKRQRTATTQRRGKVFSKGGAARSDKIKELNSWVDREMEVFVSLIDAEQSLKPLLEARADIEIHIGKLQPPGTSIQGVAALQEIETLEKELKMRNAEIAKLSQKVSSINLETRMDTFCKDVQSVADSHSILKRLMHFILDMRRECTHRAVQQKTALHEALERVRQLKQEKEAYEDQIRLLPEGEESSKIHEEQLDALREELQFYKSIVEDFNSTAEEKAVKNKEQDDAKTDVPGNQSQNVGAEPFFRRYQSYFQKFVFTVQEIASRVEFGKIGASKSVLNTAGGEGGEAAKTDAAENQTV